MKRNMFRWIEEIKSSRIKKPMPVLSFPGIQILNITVREIVENGGLQAKCMKAIADRYDTAASVSNMDLSVEAEAFGANIVFSDYEVPTVTGSLINTDEEVEALKIPKVETARTGQYIKAIEIASKKITDRPVLAGVIGPFSLSGRLVEITEFMMKTITEPDIANKVLVKAAQFLTDYILAFKEAGANGIVMAEPAAGLLSPELCSEFSSAYIKQIIETVEDENFLVVYHNCGNTAPLINEIISTDARVIHLGNAINLVDVIHKYPEEKLIMGNLDPAGVFLNGTIESITNSTRSLLKQMSRYPNWLISSGCDIPPMTPLANIDAFFNTIQNFYQSK
ncbi:MAG: uroporphyrinogen decarboxylase family protein [Melioribacteraceae bacterium]|nr:uroporphyrinogen decarboxylase family protein [Melioribacteraceae bacterium]